MPALTIPSIALTLVPNGAVPAKHPLYPGMARASVLITPSHVDGMPVKGSVFENWPEAAEELRRAISSSVKINCLVRDSTKTPAVDKTTKVEKINLETPSTKEQLELGAKMWTTLMVNVDQVKNHARQTAEVASQKLAHWHLSHDTGALDYVHQEHR